MPTDPLEQERELRALIADLLYRRRDVTPAELVEVLGDHVLWSPETGPASREAGAAPRAADRACAA